MHRSALRPSLLVAALAAAAALALPVAAGAASKAPSAGALDAPAWAQRVCSAVLDWSKAAERSAGNLEGKVSATDLKRSRAVLSRFMDDVVRETDRMITRVDAAGTPDIKQGAAIRQQLRANLRRARGLLADGRREAAALSVTDKKAFSKGATALGNRIETQFGALAGAIEKIDELYPSAKLDAAFAAAPACKKL